MSKPLTVSSYELSESEYISEVLSMPRDKVSNLYADVYAGSMYWEDHEWSQSDYVDGDLLLTDEGVQTFAEQDYADGPEVWVFQTDEFWTED